MYINILGSVYRIGDEVQLEHMFHVLGAPDYSNDHEGLRFQLDEYVFKVWGDRHICVKLLGRRLLDIKPMGRNYGKDLGV